MGCTYGATVANALLRVIFKRKRLLKLLSVHVHKYVLDNKIKQVLSSAFWPSCKITHGDITSLEAFA